MASAIGLAAMLLIGTSIGSTRLAIQQDRIANQQTEFAGEQKRLKGIADEKSNLAKQNAQLADVRADRAERAERKIAWREYASKIKLAQTEWNDGDARAAWLALNSCRWDLRGWEHDYLYTKFTRNQLNLSGHTGYVLSVAFSPDGTQIVSESFDRTIKVWSATSGEETLTLKGHTDSVSSVAFSPDGTQIVSGSYDNTITVWSATNSEETLNQ